MPNRKNKYRRKRKGKGASGAQIDRYKVAFERSCIAYLEIRSALASGLIVKNKSAHGRFGNSAATILDWCCDFDLTVSRHFKRPKDDVNPDRITQRFFDWLWKTEDFGTDGWGAQIGPLIDKAGLYPLSHYLRPAITAWRQKVTRTAFSLMNNS